MLIWSAGTGAENRPSVGVPTMGRPEHQAPPPPVLLLLLPNSTVEFFSSHNPILAVRLGWGTTAFTDLWGSVISLLSLSFFGRKDFGVPAAETSPASQNTALFAISGGVLGSALAETAAPAAGERESPPHQLGQLRDTVMQLSTSPALPVPPGCPPPQGCPPPGCVFNGFECTATMSLLSYP